MLSGASEAIARIDLTRTRASTRAWAPSTSRRSSTSTTRTRAPPAPRRSCSPTRSASSASPSTSTASSRGGRTRAELRRPDGLDALHPRLRPADCIPPPARRSSPRARRWSRSTSRSTRRWTPRSRSRRRCAPTLDVRALGLQLTDRVQVSTNIEDHTHDHRRRSGRGGPRSTPRSPAPSSSRPPRAPRSRTSRKTCRSGARNLWRIIYPRRSHGPDEAQEADQASRQCRGLDRGARPHRPQAHRGGAEGGRPRRRSGAARRRKPPTLEQRRAEGAGDGRDPVRPDPDRHPRRRHERRWRRASSWRRWRWSSTRRWPTSTDRWVYRRTQKRAAAAEEILMEARWLTVGPVQENTWIARPRGSEEALLIDPGDEPDTLKTALERARRHRRGDPDHALPLRPRRRGRRDGAQHRRARLLPRRRGLHPREHQRLRALPGLRAVRVLLAREDGQATATSCTLAGFEIDVIGTPGHSPTTSRTRSPRRRRSSPATCSSRARSAAPTCPGGDHQTLMASDRQAAGHAAGRDRRAARPHGADHARRRARKQPVPARARVPGERFQTPRGTYDVLPETALDRDRLEATARKILERAGYGRIETPTFEATELFARGVGEATDVVQKEMFSFGDEEDSYTLRPGGHRAGRALLHGARHAQAAAAGEALVPVELLPPRDAAGRALPAVLAGRGGGDRLARPGRRRRGDPAAGRAAGGDRRARREARASPRSASPSRAPRTARS